jgi:hypothetical protein
VEVGAELPVVVRERIVHGVDAGEVLGVEHVLQAGPAANLQVEISRQRMDRRIEQRHAGNGQWPAAFQQGGAQLEVDQGEEHRPRFGFDPGQDLVYLPLGPDQRPGMLDRLHALELHEAGAGDRTDGFAGRVGYQM